MAAYSSAGRVPLVIWAATVDPADVPMMSSAPVTSRPASERPAMSPSSHALPAAPAPARTRARASGWLGCRLASAEVVARMRGVEEGNVLKGVAFRECAEGALPVATSSVARSCTAGEHPLGILRSRVSPPAGGSRSAGRLAGPDAVRHGGHWPGARRPPLPWVPTDPSGGGPPGGRLDRCLPGVLVG